MDMLKKSKTIDAFILSIFVILVTLFPFFIHGSINLFEVGIYLPGIQSVLNGDVPYRDVFHLRGPFELYIPAFLMKMFGVHIQWLYLYFYIGTVLCLIFGVLIAKELFATRLMLYLFVPVFVARTFPRVVFTYWGGMRYAFGLLTIWLILKFFKKEKIVWMFLAGLTTSLGLFTSVEMGIYPVMGVVVAFFVSAIFKIYDIKQLIKAFLAYSAGMLFVIVPTTFYLIAQHAFIPYLDSIIAIITKMQKVFDPHLVSIYPSNFKEALIAMTNPVHTNFKHMTPSYLYIAILIYLIIRIKDKKLTKTDVFIFCLGIYGFIMYNTGFRGIWAAQFEMALQPEKILLFFFFEVLLLELLKRKDIGPNGAKIKVCFNTFMWVLILSSIGYAMQRYNHRFWVFRYVSAKISGKKMEKLIPALDKEMRPLTFDRASGIIVPNKQADELEAVSDFVKTNVGANETIFTYPELGTYNFLFDRPFLGRFPIATFSWFDQKWHEELMGNLKSHSAKYAIVEKEISNYWAAVYLVPEPNKQKYQEVIDFIQANYTVVKETPKSFIYKLR